MILWIHKKTGLGEVVAVQPACVLLLGELFSACHGLSHGCAGAQHAEDSEVDESLHMLECLRAVPLCALATAQASVSTLITSCYTAEYYPLFGFLRLEPASEGT